MTSGPRYREDFLTINAPSTTSLEPRISSLEQDVASVKADATSHEAQYQALTLKVNTAEGSITNLSGQVSSSVTLANQNKQELSGLSASLAGVQTTLSQAATSHSQQVALLQEQISGLGGAASSLDDLENEIKRVDGRATAISNNSGLTRTALTQLIEWVVGPDAEWPIGSGVFTLPIGKTSIIDSLVERIVALEQAATAPPPEPEPEPEWEWSLDAKRGGDSITTDPDNLVTKWHSLNTKGVIEHAWYMTGTAYLSNPPGLVYLPNPQTGMQTTATSLFNKTIYTVCRLEKAGWNTPFQMGVDAWNDNYRYESLPNMCSQRLSVGADEIRLIGYYFDKNGVGRTVDGERQKTPFGGLNRTLVVRSSISATETVIAAQVPGFAPHINRQAGQETAGMEEGAHPFRFGKLASGNVYELRVYDSVHDDAKAAEVMAALLTKHDH